MTVYIFTTVAVQDHSTKSTFKQWLQLDCRCIKQEYVHTKLNVSTVVKGDM